MVSGAALCRFPEGKLDFAKQNRPVLGVIVLPLNPFKKSVYGGKSSAARLGCGGEVYFGAEGL